MPLRYELTGEATRQPRCERALRRLWKWRATGERAPPKGAASPSRRSSGAPSPASTRSTPRWARLRSCRRRGTSCRCVRKPHRRSDRIAQTQRAPVRQVAMPPAHACCPRKRGAAPNLGRARLLLRAGGCAPHPCRCRAWKTRLVLTSKTARGLRKRRCPLRLLR